MLDGTQDAKLPLHASHVAPSDLNLVLNPVYMSTNYCHRVIAQLQLNKYYYYYYYYSSASASGSHCRTVLSLLDPLWFCTTQFGPISIAPHGDAGVAIVETVVLLSNPQECLLGRFAGSMLCDVLSSSRSSPLLLIRSFCVGLRQVLRIGYSVVRRILCRRSFVGRMSWITPYQFTLTAAWRLFHIFSQSAVG